MKMLSYEAKIVPIIAPIDINGGAKTSKYFNLKDAKNASIIVALGAVAAGHPSTITVLNAASNAGAGATAIPFNYRQATGADLDSLGDLISATNAGVATDGATSDVFYVIEIQDSELADGSPYLAVALSSPGAFTFPVSAYAILNDVRYTQEYAPSALS